MTRTFTLGHWKLLALVAVLGACLSVGGATIAISSANSVGQQHQASASAISYAKARRILLNKVIKPKSLAAGDAVIAFSQKRALAKGTRIAPHRNRGRIVNLRQTSYFFWVDDDPKAQFEHGTRYVFINAKTGRVKVYKQKWWPLVDRKAPWLKSSQYWNKRNWAYSNVTPPASAARVKAAAASLPIARTSASTPECAVLVAGSSDAKAGFPEDVDGMEKVLGGTFKYTLRKLKAPKNNKADLEKAVEELVADGCKNMLIYIASHGSKEKVDMGTGSYTAAELKALMEKYPTIDFKVVVQACQSGSWVGAIGGKPEIVITSTDGDKPSYSADPDTDKDPNPNDKGSEFTSGLIEDLQEIANNPQLQQRVQQCMAGNTSTPGKPRLVCQLEIAFESALAKDEDAQAGKTNPQRKLK